MTIRVVSQLNALTAWKAAAELLLGLPGTHANNLVIEIEHPTTFDPDWFRAINSRLINSHAEDPRNVANTIFPSKTWQNSLDREGFYKRYLNAHRRGEKKSWGTYFQRLIHFGASGVNQLERAIEVLNTWQNEPGTAIVLHLSSAETDT